MRSVSAFCLFIHQLCNTFFPPLWASAVTIPVWVCCHLLTKSCGIWGCKVDMCGMAPRTLYGQPNAEHMLFCFLCANSVGHGTLIDLCPSRMRLCSVECDRQQGDSEALIALSCYLQNPSCKLSNPSPTVKTSWVLEAANNVSRPQGHPAGKGNRKWF